MNQKKLNLIVVVVLIFAFAFIGCSTNGTSQAPAKSVDSKPSQQKSASEAVTAEGDDNSLQRVLDAGRLTVVGSGGYPPFNYIDDNGEVIGFDVDVGAEIAKRLGVELNYVTGEWSGLTEGLRSGRYDGILGSMAITEERLQTVNFSIPYYYSGAQLVVRGDAGFTNPSEMNGRSVAVTTGTNYEQDATGLGADVKLYDDDNLTMMELIKGRVDGVITDRLVALKAMKEMKGGQELTLCGAILRLEKMGIAIQKEDQSLLDKVDEIVQEMHDDGTLTAISKKWHDGADITVK